MKRTLTTLFALLAATPAGAATVNLQPGDDVAQLTGGTLAPGDEYIFADGVYELGETVWWEGVGTEADPIVFRAADGATPILRASGGWAVVYLGDSAFVEIRGLVLENDEAHYDGARGSGLVVEDSSDVVVEDVEVRHVGGTGIDLSGNLSRVALRRVHVHDTREGMGVYSGCWDASCWTQDSEIANCWIHDIRGDNSRGIYVENGGQGLRIVDNVVYATGHGGIRTASAEFGTPNVIEGNVVWNSVWSGIAVTGAATVRNNVVFQVDGIGIYSDDGDRGTLENLVISHNTVVDTTQWGIQINEWAGKTGMVLANNAVSNPVGMALEVGETDVDAGVYIAGNRFTGYVDADAVDPTTGSYAPGGGYGDFQDVEGWDLYPTAGSLLVNAADASASAWVPDEDFNGVPRDGLAPDVGAYEYLGAANPGWVLQEGFKSIGYVDDSAQDVGGCGCQKGSEASMLAPLLLLGLGRRRRRA